MRTSHAILATLITLVATSCALFVTAMPSSAYFGHKYLYDLVSELGSPDQVGVDSHGDAYVTGRSEGLVEKLAPGGQPGTFTAKEPYIDGAYITGTSEKAFGSVVGVAVDDSTGDIYISSEEPEVEDSVVDVFNATGEYQFDIKEVASSAPVPGPIVGAENLTMDQATHELYVIDKQQKVVGSKFVENHDIDVFSASGIYLKQMVLGTKENEDPRAVAVDDETGKIYVMTTAGLINVFSHAGVLEQTFTGEGAPGDHFENASIAIDQTDGHIFVTSAQGSEFVEGIDELSSAGVYLSQVREAEGHRWVNVHIAGVDESTGDLYIVAENALGNGQRGPRVIHVFGPQVVLPDVLNARVDKLLQTSVTFTGEVGPDGLSVSSCGFKYGLTLSYGLSQPCSPLPGSSNTIVPVSANVEGLRPNSTYHYQLEVTNENGSNYSEDETFATPPSKPAVVSESTPVVGPREALLEGVVNPENSDTSYRFVYGPTSGYGQSVPASNLDIGSEYEGVHVEKSLAGLQAGAIYHYAVVATNQAGTTYGPDETFTAGFPVVPSVSTGGVVALSQNGAVVSGTIDSFGTQTGYEFDLGTDTSYGTRVFGNAGSGNGPEVFTALFPSLEPGTTYHYRLVATSTYGTTYGADQSFTTPGFPTAVLTAPGSLSLVAVPQIVFPTTTSSVAIPKAKTKAKKKKKGKKTKKPSPGKAHKSGGRASRSGVRGAK